MAPHPWDVIVIGAGLGGLTAAALLAKAGQKVLVLERNRAPGGAAITYARTGRQFHLPVMGQDPSGLDPITRVFDGLNLWDRITQAQVAPVRDLRLSAFGQQLLHPIAPDAALTDLSARYPQQTEALSGFAKRLHETRHDLAKAAALQDGAWWQQSSVLNTYPQTLGDVLTDCFGADETLKLVIAAWYPFVTDDLAALWWPAFVASLGLPSPAEHTHVAGGSSHVARVLAQIVDENGGSLQLNAEVTGLVTRDGAVIGIEWQGPDGPVQKTQASAIVAAIAPPSTADLLPERHRARFERSFAKRPLSASQFEVTFAVALPGQSLGLQALETLLLPPWMTKLSDFSQASLLMGVRPGKRMPPLRVVDYGQIGTVQSDRVPAPISVTGVDRIDNWLGLSERAYDKRKAAWVEAITAALDGVWPGFAASVMRADMTTARNLHDTYASPGGAAYGFAATPPAPEGEAELHVASALDGLYVASGFVGYGGYGAAMDAGRRAAQAVLRTG